MMEQWNDGIMGSGKMENRVVDRIRLGREVNRVNMINFLLKPTPLKTGSSTFQYSTIPLFHARPPRLSGSRWRAGAGQKLRPRKNLYSQ
jgi:hypothetical protein